MECSFYGIVLYIHNYVVFNVIIYRTKHHNYDTITRNFGENAGIFLGVQCRCVIFNAVCCTYNVFIYDYVV